MANIWTSCGGKEVILSNNDYIAIVDAAAVQVEIKAIQDGFISVLTNYRTDFVRESEKELGDSFLNRFIFNLMKNQNDNYVAYAGIFGSRTKQLINRLERLTHQAVVFGLSTNQKLNQPQAVALAAEPVELEPNSPSSASRRLFDAQPLESKDFSRIEVNDNAMSEYNDNCPRPGRTFAIKQVTC